MDTSPYTPFSGKGLKRARLSPRTQSPITLSMAPPIAPDRLHFRNSMSSPVRQNLLAAFDEAARLAEEEARLRQEAAEFHAEQDGEEQEVPNSVMCYAAQEPKFSISWFYGEEASESEYEEDYS